MDIKLLQYRCNTKIIHKFNSFKNISYQSLVLYYKCITFTLMNTATYLKTAKELGIKDGDIMLTGRGTRVVVISTETVPCSVNNITVKPLDDPYYKGCFYINPTGLTRI